MIIRVHPGSLEFLGYRGRGGGRKDFTTLSVIPATYTLWRQQTMNQLRFELDVSSTRVWCNPLDDCYLLYQIFKTATQLRYIRPAQIFWNQKKTELINMAEETRGYGQKCKWIIWKEREKTVFHNSVTKRGQYRTWNDEGNGGETKIILEELTGTRTNKISGFHRGINEVFARLERYAV